MLVVTLLTDLEASALVELAADVAEAFWTTSADLGAAVVTWLHSARDRTRVFHKAACRRHGAID